jgi:hypothetical protein
LGLVHNQSFKVNEASQRCSDVVPGTTQQLLNKYTYRLSLGASLEWEEEDHLSSASACAGRAAVSFARMNIEYAFFWHGLLKTLIFDVQPSHFSWTMGTDRPSGDHFNGASRAEENLVSVEVIFAGNHLGMKRI